MHKILIVAAALAVAWPAAAQQSGKKTFQCWTDENGQRMCGDRVPPKYADKERQVINDRGIVVETKERAKTEEELAEEARLKAEAEEAARRAEYERSLVQTYRNVSDLEHMRDERVAILDTRIRGAEKTLTDTEASLKDLYARADKQKADGKAVDERLAKQIRQFERTLNDTQASLERMRGERIEIRDQFNADIVRFSELKGLPPPTFDDEDPAATDGTGDGTGDGAAEGDAPAAAEAKPAG